jgi:hypothetical protein
VLSEHFPAASAGKEVLESSVSNAEALWRTFASARGRRIIDETLWLAVDAGQDIGGTRVILRSPVGQTPHAVIPGGTAAKTSDGS